MGFRRTEYLTKRYIIRSRNWGQNSRSIEKEGLVAPVMSPADAELQAVVEEEQNGTRLYPEQVVDGLPTIYSFQSCPFCFKIRALLGSRGIPYADVEVEPMKKAELKWGGWDKVPVFVDVDGTAMEESNDILHYIDSKHGNLFPRAGNDPEQDRWMEFSNKVLGKSIVAVIYRTFGSSFRALEYVNGIENFSRKDKIVNKYLGGFVMKMVGRSRAKLFEQPPRENLKTQLDKLSGGLNGDFFGGESPNGADFANYGILRSMQGLEGFDILEDHSEGFGWYNRMQLISGI